MARGGRLQFRKPSPHPAKDFPPWMVLVVDDDEQVHDMTRLLLRDFRFEGRPFAMLSAYSAREAEPLLRDNPEIAVALVDVVMETPDAGLRLARDIRDRLGNKKIRIILRTGQPGEAPERDVVLNHDINDYKSKTELTAQKLFTALVGAARAWRDIDTIARLNKTLADLNDSLETKVLDRTRELEQSRDELAVARDRAELALLRETEAKGQLRQFLSMVSHEFRTPLAIIDSATQLIQLRADGEHGSRLETIRGAVQRMVDLMDTCLADEQLESGNLVMHERPFDIAQELEEIVAHHRTASPAREIVFHCPPQPPIWGDPGLLRLAFTNILGNALKYSETGPVVIQAGPGPSGVVVTISDHGIGIPEKDIPRIFDRFFRAENSHAKAGSGIGLHMVRQILDLHGSSIHVSSDVETGTTFTIRLRTAPMADTVS